MTRKYIILAGLLALLFVATPVLAGGWVVITLDSLPEGIQAGRPVEISFMVRQHGERPIHDLSPILIATNKDTGEEIRMEAEKAPEIGRFIVTAIFPSTGLWEWSIDARPFNQIATLAPITVLDAEQVTALNPAAMSQQAIEPGTIIPGDNSLWQIVLRWGGLSLLAVGLVLILVEQRRQPKVANPISGD